MHVHVLAPDGEAKYWIEPDIELAQNHHFGSSELKRIERLIRDHEQEIRDAWQRHFGS